MHNEKDIEIMKAQGDVDCLVVYFSVFVPGEKNC